MSAELSAIEALASDNITAWFRLSATSQAVLFYATNYLTRRQNWISDIIPDDVVSDADWDTIESYVDQLLFEAKTPMIGQLMAYITADPPPNVLPCDGSSYLRVDFPDLYAVLDSAFIVDADHFAVPDLRGRTIIGAGDGSGLTTRSVAATGGEEQHQLSEGELAAHVHAIPLTATTLAVEPGEVTVMTPVPLFTQNTGSKGGDEAHNNMQPFFVLNYGVFAS